MTYLTRSTLEPLYYLRERLAPMTAVAYDVCRQMPTGKMVAAGPLDPQGEGSSSLMNEIAQKDR
jgi:hypothetical protein